MSQSPTVYVYEKQAALRRSPTMSAADMAKQAKAMGVDVDVFTLGDLFPKPLESEVASWREALKTEAAKPENAANPIYQLRDEKRLRAYSETTGIPSLRAAIAALFSNDTGIAATADEVMVGNGGKGALSGALYYLATKENPTVLLAAPGWPTNYDLFPPHTRLIEVDTQGRGLFTPALLKASLATLDVEPDVILINAPNNPTGDNYDSAERDALMQVVLENTQHTLLASDNPYGRLVFDRNPYVIGEVLTRGEHEKALYDAGRLAEFRSVTKEYGMADSRVGWVITKNKVVLTSLQSYNESIGGGMSVRNQEEAQAALMFGHGFIEKSQAELLKKRDMLINGISALRYADVKAPASTIYGWVNFARLKGANVPASATPDGEGFTIKTPKDMLRYLVFVAGICVVSGQAFYAPGSPAADSDWHVRMSFCGEEATLARGLEKLKQAETKLEHTAKAA